MLSFMCMCIIRIARHRKQCIPKFLADGKTKLAENCDHRFDNRSIPCVPTIACGSMIVEAFEKIPHVFIFTNMQLVLRRISLDKSLSLLSELAVSTNYWFCPFQKLAVFTHSTFARQINYSWPKHYVSPKLLTTFCISWRQPRVHAGLGVQRRELGQCIASGCSGWVRR